MGVTSDSLVVPVSCAIQYTCISYFTHSVCGDRILTLGCLWIASWMHVFSQVNKVIVSHRTLNTICPTAIGQTNQAPLA